MDGNGQEIGDAAHIGNKNPFRYRSYYFDTETGLYYLKSRYYDPEICRFITIDDISYIDPETINGLNLYAYCGNNPVMFSDPNGKAKWWQFWKWDWGKICGWIVTGIIAIGAAVLAIAGTFFTGGLLGAVISGIGFGVLSGMSYSIEKQGGFQNLSNIDPTKVLLAGTIGAVIGGISGAFAHGVSVIGKAFGEFASIMLGQSAFLGVKFSKIFNMNFLTSAGGFIGAILGGLSGSVISEYVFNNLTGQQIGINQFIEDLFSEQALGWIGDIFKYLIQ